jgi:osmotically-inducible protein OsmY
MQSVFRTLLVFVVCAFSVLAQQQKQAPDSPDGRISDQVRMRLATDPDVKGGALDVSVQNGVVTIRGKVDTEKGKKKAEKLAKKVKGVKSVENDLVVGPPTA